MNASLRCKNWQDFKDSEDNITPSTTAKAWQPQKGTEGTKDKIQT
jgi:hypothetical protein